MQISECGMREQKDIAECRLKKRKTSSFKFQSTIRNRKSAMVSGFTLVELSLVILVIGIVLALVLPNLGTPKAKLEKEREIERLSQTIKYLYNLSQVQNEKIYLLFDLNGNKFWAISLPAEEDDEEINQYLIPEKRLSSSLKMKDIIDSKGNKITEGIVPLIFHPSGFVEPATIHFMDEKGKFYTLFINPLTGQSHIESGYLEEE